MTVYFGSREKIALTCVPSRPKGVCILLCVCIRICLLCMYMCMQVLPREALMSRADSLKKAAQSLIDHATDGE